MMVSCSYEADGYLLLVEDVNSIAFPITFKGKDTEWLFFVNLLLKIILYKLDCKTITLDQVYMC